MIRLNLLLKECRKCKQVKPIKKFTRTSNGNADGFASWCKSCVQYKSNKWMKDSNYYLHHKQQYTDRNRRNRRRRLYGVTDEQFQTKLKEQGSKCAVCGTYDSGKYAWCQDHSHVTGTARGVLCSSCNKALGLFKDSVNNLANAINYLNKYREQGTSL